MTLDTRMVVRNYDGSDYIVDKSVAGKTVTVSLTLKECFLQALNTLVAGEKLSPQEKEIVYNLSVRIYTNDAIELTPDEVKTIRYRVATVWDPPVIYGRICEALMEANV